MFSALTKMVSPCLDDFISTLLNDTLYFMQFFGGSACAGGPMTQRVPARILLLHFHMLRGYGCDLLRLTGNKIDTLFP